MVSNLYIEYRDSKVLEKKFTERVKSIWKNEGRLVKDIEQIDLYYKSEEGMCYYVINTQVRGSFSVEDL